ncbi:DeoR/GlpR family DNA-binding transcription regulator [Paenibacillus sp. 32352]|uniref:DeoR/GlpR family DNA-binding transcription regulator n=1 Tax=Paenibacillus sp. 32352 TaxID=1969111 RepID=UPI0009ABBA96|nr:DeoR/GlpR family DNA-binding transcription regulator [Paenibacillus sp. 32352]
MSQSHNQVNQRQQQILDRMALTGEVKIAELKEMFDVTEMTLRRDMEKLEQWGHIKRTFGGAILLGKDIELQERIGVLIEEKMRIGRRAAELVQPGDSIFLDGGSTTLQVARCLAPDRNMTVVTNALNIAAELRGKRIPTIIVGGMMLDATDTLIGPVAANALSTMAFDRAFIGATGMAVKHGFSNSNMYETEIKRIAIAQSAEVNIVMDHTKFGKQDLFSFAALNAVNRLITDSLPDRELSDALLEASVEVVADA